MNPIELILSKLSDVKQSSDGWDAKCPAHGDSGRHLSIKVGDDGRVLLHCFHLCETEQILAAVGLKWGDLFADSGRDRKLGSIEATYDYRDSDGVLLYQVVRFEGKEFRQRRPDGDGWIWKLTGIRRVLYRLPELLAADAKRFVLVVEGEKSANALADLELITTTNSGGAGKWRDHYSETLRDRRVVVVPDNDEPGIQHARQVATSLHGIAAEVRLVTLPNLQPNGDICDWLDDGGDREALEDIVRSVPPYEPEAPPSATHEAKFSTWEDLDAILGPIEWYCEKWLPKAFLTMIVGRSSEGKSMLALQIAASFLVGRPWPDGTPYTEDTGKVIWCDTEAAQALNLERAVNWGLPIENIVSPLEDPLEDFLLDNPAHMNQLEELMHRHDVKACIIDSLSGGHTRDAGKAQAMTPIVKRLASICRDTGKLIQLVHHVRKAGPIDTPGEITLDMVRNSGVIVQFARMIWALDTPDISDLEHKRLHVLKTNLTKKAEPLGARITDTGMVFDGQAPTQPRTESAIFVSLSTS